MITLSKAKEFLSIDFDDQDQYIQMLIDSVRHSAETIMGRPVNTPEAEIAMLEDIAYRYQHRGENITGNYSSLATYRRLSERPML